MVPGLANFETLPGLIGDRLLNNLADTRHRWAILQPNAQIIQRFAGPAAQDFDVAIRQISGITGDTKALSLATSTIPKPYALYMPLDRVQARLLLV